VSPTPLLTQWQWLQIAGVVGAAWVLAVQMRKQVNGLGAKVREDERKRIKDLAVQLELHCEEPNAVRLLAQHLRDTV